MLVEQFEDMFLMKPPFTVNVIPYQRELNSLQDETTFNRI